MGLCWGLNFSSCLIIYIIMAEDFYKKFSEKQYLNKFEVGFRLPENIKLEDFWLATLKQRRGKSNSLPLNDQKGGSFWYITPQVLQKTLHEIDSYGRDSLYSLIKKEIENDLIKESLIEEAFYSSTIEGAFSTLKKAREMVQKRLPPKNNSEQMILNNFDAMRFILENKEKTFSEKLVLELHKITTKNTLEDPSFSGRFRNDWVYVTDSTGKTIYTPPPADQIKDNITKLVEWINIDSEDEFIHPLIKACVLHFYFVYLHPFFDGNGRTARALFYFYLIKNKYDFFKYFSISSIIEPSRKKYYKSIKDVEDFDSDLTYFLVFMIDCVLRAISAIKQKIKDHYQKDFFLNKIKEKNVQLNNRQQKFLSKFLLWQDKEIDISKYKTIFKVVYQTARTDLLQLEKEKILEKVKKGKKFVFIFNPNY